MGRFRPNHEDQQVLNASKLLLGGWDFSVVLGSVDWSDLTPVSVCLLFHLVSWLSTSWVSHVLGLLAQFIFRALETWPLLLSFFGLAVLGRLFFSPAVLKVWSLVLQPRLVT